MANVIIRDMSFERTGTGYGAQNLWLDQVTPPAPPPAPGLGLYRVRKWGDPVMVKQGFDTAFINGTNFQAVGLWNDATKDFGGVSNYLRIPHADVMRLRDMQRPDKYPRDQKMQWLAGEYRGRIYMLENRDDNWPDCAFIRWGTILFGGAFVKIDRIVTFPVKFPQESVKRAAMMGRVACFRRSDWARPLADLYNEGLVQRCYCAGRDKAAGIENIFTDSPKGIVYSPVWSPLDWTFTQPGKPQPTSFWTAMEWLEEV